MHFTLSDFAEVMLQIQRLGGNRGLRTLLSENSSNAADHDKEWQRSLAIIQSMTKDEREYPEQIQPNRARRIARGSGTDLKDVDDFVRQFLAMRSFLSEKQIDLGRMQKDLARWSTVPFERKIWPLK